jgi:hypothetical protein
LKQVVYAKQIATEAPADDVTGVLCCSLGNEYFFRIYHEDKTFTDYDLRHDDMTITIAANELASFYRFENAGGVLDHSSDVVRLEVVKIE